MCAKWNSNYDPHLLAERFESCCQRNANGQVAFGMEHIEYEPVLRSSLILSDEIPESEVGGIVWKGVFAAAKKGKITADSLKIEISKGERSFLNLPHTEFVVVTNLSLAQNVSLTRRPRKGSVISISGIDYGKFNRAQIINHAQPLLSANLPTNYPVARVSLKARTPNEAAIIALNDLDFLRGLWNLRLNKGSFKITFGGKKMPVNQIFIGPIHTIHRTDGSLATQQFFYEQSFSGTVICPDAQSFDRAQEFEKSTIKKLNKSKYSETIVKAVQRYGRALDDTDFSAAFLRLWSILELLTQTGNASYDLTIKRCSFLYADRIFCKLLLEHLRFHRNQHVHFASDSSQIETLLYQLKRCVEDLFFFHLNTYKWFDSFDEAIHFLDLPSEKSEINGKLKALRLAIKFHRHK